MTPVLFLDVSRLMRRFAVPGGPTGIDRVELAYARWGLGDTAFTVVPVARRGRSLGTLRPGALEKVVDTLRARWGRAANTKAQPVLHPLQIAAGEVGARRLISHKPLDAGGAPSVYLNVGHDGLDEADRLNGVPGACAALVHDIIPITHPEYDTPRATRLMERRVATLAARADHVVCISNATRAALEKAAPQRRFSISVLHLAPGLLPGPRKPASTPTFLHLSSIDRRKNVPLLLHIWRDMADGAEPVPHLTLIGRRGNDATALELIDRCTSLAPHVTIAGAASDEDVLQQLASATALLSPTFVEGFGLPVLEARAAGLPVVASDIPSHREVGGPDTIFCHPLDGPAWRAAIEALARDRPEPGPAQTATWSHHLAAVQETLLSLAR